MSAARTFAADMRQAVVDKPSHELVDDAVVALASLVPCGHELEVAEEGELMADR